MLDALALAFILRVELNAACDAMHRCGAMAAASSALAGATVDRMMAAAMVRRMGGAPCEGATVARG